MADLKKSLIDQVEQLMRKGELSEPQYRTLVTKIELASPKFLEMAMKKFETIRKSVKDEDESVKKVGEAPAPTPTPPAAAAKPAPSTGSIGSAPGGAGVGPNGGTAGMGAAGTHT